MLFRSLDYFECRFNSAFRTLRIDFYNREAALANRSAAIDSGEEPADEHDEQDEHDVPADLVHVLIPDLRVSATGGPAPPSPKWDQAVAPARQMCAQSKQSAAELGSLPEQSP